MKKSFIFKGFKGVPLKENLCIFTVENKAPKNSPETKEREVLMYHFKWVRGEHIEVFLDGVFQFSADNMAEALKELRGDAE